MIFPIYLFRERIGEVSWERAGLYFEYRASLFREPGGFVRLFLCRQDGVLPLGLFRDQTLRGRISQRSAQAKEGCFAFTVLREGYLPPEAYSEAPPLAFCAKRCGGGWEYCIPTGEVDDNALPFLCFFRACSVNGRSCVNLTQDRDGKPYLPQLSP